MGLLVDGKWQDQWYDTSSTGGRFVRQDSAFRDWITNDGSSAFPAESGRYHLYVSLACPWAHRALIFRTLKCLDDAISLSIVDPLMLEHGWAFSDGPGCIPDTVNGADYLYQVYQQADPDYSGRVTVPVLWDRESATIVNNESSEIIRMLNRAFNACCDRRADEDHYPEDLRAEIDHVNEIVYKGFNNGVYRCGFATSQEAYDEAVLALFETTDWIESQLEARECLAGDRITEADWRFFTTALRFDPVYYGHFKCNLRHLSDYPRISAHLKRLLEVKGVAGTVNMDHIKRHYYGSQRTLNPSGIVPVGPALDWWPPGGAGSTDR